MRTKTAPTFVEADSQPQTTSSISPLNPASELFIVGTESEAEILRRRGYAATARPRIPSLEGAHVVLVATSTNRRQLAEYASRLLGIASKIELVILTGLMPGEDCRIWFSHQSADNGDREFADSARVEITSAEGIHTYLKEPPYAAIPTPELCKAFVAAALMAGWSQKEALEFVSSILGGSR